MPKYVQIETGQNRSDLYVTGSVNRDFKNLREFYIKNVDTFVKAYDVCKKLFKLKDEHKLFIRNIRGSTVGFYRNGNKEVAIDIRRKDIKSIVSTIIHECRHAYQYQSGMLKPDPKKRNYYIWTGFDTKTTKAADGSIVDLVAAKKSTSIRKYRPSQSMKKYLALPWEVDARAAEKKYINKVMEELK